MNYRLIGLRLKRSYFDQQMRSKLCNNRKPRVNPQQIHSSEVQAELHLFD